MRMNSALVGINGAWQPLTEARSTADANPITNIDAGIDSNCPFRATRGDVENKTVPLREQMELEAIVQPPPPMDCPPSSRHHSA